MDDARRADVGLWLKKAREDLAVVRLVIAGRGPSPVACFLCQQAAEKFLKAVLVAAGVDPPYVHDLDLLARLIAEAGCALDIDPDALLSLRAYAVAPRYPGFPDDQADRDLDRLLGLAESVEAAVVAAIARL